MKKRRKPVHTTFKGRVVYDRKKHLFSMKDVLRIARTLDPPKNYPDAVLLVLELARLINLLFTGILRKFSLFEWRGLLLDFIIRTIQDFVSNLEDEPWWLDILLALKLVSPHMIADTMPTPAPVYEEAKPVTFIAVEVTSLGKRSRWQDPITGWVWEPVYFGPQHNIPI